MKVSNKQIIEVLENNEDGKNKTQIAAELGITIQGLNKRLKNLSVKVEDHVEQYARKRALITVSELAQQSKAGKTEATKALLKLARIDSDSPLIAIDARKWDITIQKIEPAEVAEVKQLE